jgi:hypothetical protein
MGEERRKDGELWERVAVLKEQVGRLVSDAESEKDTRRRVNADIFERFKVFEERLRKIDKSIWLATGAISVIVLLVNLLAKHI